MTGGTPAFTLASIGVGLTLLASLIVAFFRRFVFLVDIAIVVIARRPGKICVAGGWMPVEYCARDDTT